MRYPEIGMPMVLVIAKDWKLRDALQFELRERGFDSLGIGTAEEADRAPASRDAPAAIVLESTAEFAANPAIHKLVTRAPTILIASHAERLPLPPVVAVFYRPVNVGEIVAKVSELLARGRDA